MFGAARGATSDDRATLTNAKQIAENFAANPQGWLILTGPWGCGKTHLAVAIAQENIKRGRSVFFRRSGIGLARPSPGGFQPGKSHRL